ncbi:MAG TPA: IS21-like element helper ATPase IstB [Syntrophales bacterium]|nr:IS21-like element helper ATPase IstB [Syntrophales bacterium]HLE17769.1 IS21-like element helper ATPase IstB [Syntrophales bacterium]
MTTSNESLLESVKEKLKILRLKSSADNIQQILERAEKQNVSTLQVIDRLLDLELERKRQCRISLKYKQSKLFEKPTIDQFDFHFHVSRMKQKARIVHLLDLAFIQQRKDIIFIGNTGLGKSYLAKCLAYAATQAGVGALFTTAMDMINQLTAAEADHSLLKKLHLYQAPEVLAIDEVGYLPLGNHGSNLFFQVISARHEKKSTIITTNLPFADWAKIFDSTTVASAIADRLVHNSEVIIFEGPSYRTRAKAKQVDD